MEQVTALETKLALGIKDDVSGAYGRSRRRRRRHSCSEESANHYEHLAEGLLSKANERPTVVILPRKERQSSCPFGQGWPFSSLSRRYRWLWGRGQRRGGHSK